MASTSDSSQVQAAAAADASPAATRKSSTTRSSITSSDGKATQPTRSQSSVSCHKSPLGAAVRKGGGHSRRMFTHSYMSPMQSKQFHVVTPATTDNGHDTVRRVSAEDANSLTHTPKVPHLDREKIRESELAPPPLTAESPDNSASIPVVRTRCRHQKSLTAPVSAAGPIPYPTRELMLEDFRLPAVMEHSHVRPDSSGSLVSPLEGLRNGRKMPEFLCDSGGIFNAPLSDFNASSTGSFTVNRFLLLDNRTFGTSGRSSSSFAVENSNRNVTSVETRRARHGRSAVEPVYALGKSAISHVENPNSRSSSFQQTPMAHQTAAMFEQGEMREIGYRTAFGGSNGVMDVFEAASYANMNHSGSAQKAGSGGAVKPASGAPTPLRPPAALGAHDCSPSATPTSVSLSLPPGPSDKMVHVLVIFKRLFAVCYVPANLRDQIKLDDLVLVESEIGENIGKAAEDVTEVFRSKNFNDDQVRVTFFPDSVSSSILALYSGDTAIKGHTRMQRLPTILRKGVNRDKKKAYFARYRDNGMLDSTTEIVNKYTNELRVFEVEYQSDFKRMTLFYGRHSSGADMKAAPAPGALPTTLDPAGIMRQTHSPGWSANNAVPPPSYDPTPIDESAIDFARIRNELASTFRCPRVEFIEINNISATNLCNDVIGNVCDTTYRAIYEKVIQSDMRAVYGKNRQAQGPKTGHKIDGDRKGDDDAEWRDNGYLGTGHASSNNNSGSITDKSNYMQGVTNHPASAGGLPTWSHPNMAAMSTPPAQAQAPMYSYAPTMQPVPHMVPITSPYASPIGHIPGHYPAMAMGTTWVAAHDAMRQPVAYAPMMQAVDGTTSAMYPGHVMVSPAAMQPMMVPQQYVAYHPSQMAMGYPGITQYVPANARMAAVGTPPVGNPYH